MTPTVYVAFREMANGRKAIGVFTTREKAEKAIDLHPYNPPLDLRPTNPPAAKPRAYDIEEFGLDLAIVGFETL